MKHLQSAFIIGLVLLVMAGPYLGRVSADWDYGGGWSGGDSGFYSYFGW